jgi:hypothetical protein
VRWGAVGGVLGLPWERVVEIEICQCDTCREGKKEGVENAAHY